MDMSELTLQFLFVMHVLWEGILFTRPLALLEPFGHQNRRKSGGAKEGCGLWRRLRAEGAQGYPLTPKMDAQGDPKTPKGTQNAPKWSQTHLPKVQTLSRNLAFLYPLAACIKVT